MNLRVSAVLLLSFLFTDLAHAEYWDRSENNGAYVLFRKEMPDRKIVWNGEVDEGGYATGPGCMDVYNRGISNGSGIEKLIATYCGTMDTGTMNYMEAKYIATYEVYKGNAKLWKKDGEGCISKMNREGGPIESTQWCGNFVMDEASRDNTARSEARELPMPVSVPVQSNPTSPSDAFFDEAARELARKTVSAIVD